MAAVILSRLRWSVVVLIAVCGVAFLLTFIVPSDPARSILGAHATPEALARVRASMGLDRPPLDQLLGYLGRLVQGDLGTSYQLGGVRVLDLILAKLPATILLAFAGVSVGLAVGCVVGVAAARRPGGVVDRIAAIVGSFVVALPTFLIALVLLDVFATRLGWVPVRDTDFDPLDVRALALPAIVLGLAVTPQYVRVCRTAMREQLHQDYIRTARAKGISERRTVWHHAMRNALPTIVTQACLDLGFLLGGVVVVESVFGWPGIGQQAVAAITSEDIPVLMGTLLLSTLCIVLANLAADIANMLLDPRTQDRDVSR
jgi:peptide/nickel transport system permease protein